MHKSFHLKWSNLLATSALPVQLLTDFLARLPLQRAFEIDRSPPQAFSHFLFQLCTPWGLLRQSIVQVLRPSCCEETPQTPAHGTYHKQGIHWRSFLHYRRTDFASQRTVISFCAASHTQKLNLTQRQVLTIKPFSLLSPIQIHHDLYTYADASVYTCISMCFTYAYNIDEWRGETEPPTAQHSIQRDKNANQHNEYMPLLLSERCSGAKTMSRVGQPW